MVISVRVSDEAGNLLKEYAEMKGVTVSQLLRAAVQEQMDSEYKFYAARKEVMKERPVYSMKNVSSHNKLIKRGKKRKKSAAK